MNQIIDKSKPVWNTFPESIQSIQAAVPAILVRQSAEQLQRIEDKLDRLLANQG